MLVKVFRDTVVTFFKHEKSSKSFGYYIQKDTLSTYWKRLHLYPDLLDIYAKCSAKIWAFCGLFHGCMENFKM